MKVNLKQEIINVDGKPFNSAGITVESVMETLSKSPILSTVQNLINLYNESVKPLELGQVLYNCLVTNIDDDKNISLQKKVDIAKLSYKILNTEGEFEISSEQITMLKERLPKVFTSNILVAIVSELLEGKDIFKD